MCRVRTVPAEFLSDHKPKLVKIRPDRRREGRTAGARRIPRVKLKSLKDEKEREIFR